MGANSRLVVGWQRHPEQLFCHVELASAIADNFRREALSFRVEVFLDTHESHRAVRPGQTDYDRLA